MLSYHIMTVFNTISITSPVLLCSHLFCVELDEEVKRDTSNLQLHLLPKFLIYNILEFMVRMYGWPYFLDVCTKCHKSGRADFLRLSFIY